MRRFLVWMAAGVLVGASAPAGLAAQGYGIYEHGTCMMGRAGTGTATPCADGSAIFFNPAGIFGGGTKGTLSAGVTYALMIIMFGMGLTLTLPDFALVLRRPVPVIAGVAFQFALMPLLAYPPA